MSGPVDLDQAKQKPFRKMVYDSAMVRLCEAIESMTRDCTSYPALDWVSDLQDPVAVDRCQLIAAREALDELVELLAPRPPQPTAAPGPTDDLPG